MDQKNLNILNGIYNYSDNHIFEYLNGVPHTIWFDNDSALVKIINLENGTISRN